MHKVFVLQYVLGVKPCSDDFLETCFSRFEEGDEEWLLRAACRADSQTPFRKMLERFAFLRDWKNLDLLFARRNHAKMIDIFLSFHPGWTEDPEKFAYMRHKSWVCNYRAGFQICGSEPYSVELMQELFDYDNNYSFREKIGMVEEVGRILSISAADIFDFLITEGCVLNQGGEMLTSLQSLIYVHLLEKYPETVAAFPDRIIDLFRGCYNCKVKNFKVSWKFPRNELLWLECFFTNSPKVMDRVKPEVATPLIRVIESIMAGVGPEVWEDGVTDVRDFEWMFYAAIHYRNVLCLRWLYEKFPQFEEAMKGHQMFKFFEVSRYRQLLVTTEFVEELMRVMSAYDEFIDYVCFDFVKCFSDLPFLTNDWDYFVKMKTACIINPTFNLLADELMISRAIEVYDAFKWEDFKIEDFEDEDTLMTMLGKQLYFRRFPKIETISKLACDALELGFVKAHHWILEIS
jgi:hypothetical protein